MSPDYESDLLLAQYLLFHYGSAEDILPWGDGPHEALDFPQRCVRQGPVFPETGAKLQVLDLGCAVGRVSFEVARLGHHCLGVDLSRSFINAAKTLQKKGEYPIHIQLEGRRRVEFVARAPVVDADLLRFEIADAENLPETIGTFDIVFACNLLCRLNHPLQLLRRFASLVKPGGQLFLTTPYSWMENHTAAYHGLETNYRSSFEAIRAELQGCFCLLKQQDMPLLIREHLRKYQWIMAHATLWRRS